MVPPKHLHVEFWTKITEILLTVPELAKVR